MPANVRARYEALVATGKIERDRAQDQLLGLFDELERHLAEHRLARKSSSLGWLFGARERKDQPIKGLFELGVVVVATSNVAPDELYRNGLNRALFLPFIALITQRMDVVRLSARTDFRLEKLMGQPVWHVPADTAADAALDDAWRRL